MQTPGRGAKYEDYELEQAIPLDYSNTNYDRGHLNPNSYQCHNSRTATFTLTNAVPQDPCFNQQSWKQMEEVAKKVMRTNCPLDGRYFVTGVVPKRTKIPNEVHDKEEDRKREFNRVTVPRHMWTAVCCHDISKQGQGFSFAYIGKNTAGSIVETMPVSDLEARLVSNDLDVDRYESVKIFADDCYEKSQESIRIRDQVSHSMDIRVANALDDFSRVPQSSIPPKKRKLVHQTAELIAGSKGAAYDFLLTGIDLGMTLARNSILLNKAREVLLTKGASLMLVTPHLFIPVLSRTPAKELDGAYGNNTASSKQNRTMIRSNDEPITPVQDKYLIVPDLNSSDMTVEGDRCVNSRCGFNESTSYRWCYTDLEKNYGYCCTDKCLFKENKLLPTCPTGSVGRVACSMRSSTITVKGISCLPGHECGLHGENYYWCYNDMKKNWNYCCQPWHVCNKYGESYKWCYVGKYKETKWRSCYY